MPLETNKNSEINKPPNASKGKEKGDGVADILLDFKTNANNEVLAHQEVEKGKGCSHNFCEISSYYSEGNNNECRLRQSHGCNALGVEQNLGFSKFHSDTECLKSNQLQKKNPLLFSPKQADDQTPQYQRNQSPTAGNYNSHQYHGQCACTKDDQIRSKRLFQNFPKQEFEPQTVDPALEIYLKMRETGEIAQCRMQSRKDQLLQFEKRNNIDGESTHEPQKMPVSDYIGNSYNNENMDKLLSERYPTAASKMLNKYKDTHRQHLANDFIDEDDHDNFRQAAKAQLTDQREESRQSFKPQDSMRSFYSRSSTRSNHSKKAEELIKLERSKCEAFSSIKDGIERYSTQDKKYRKKPEKTEPPEPSLEQPNSIDELIKQFRSNNVTNIINEAKILQKLDGHATKFK